MHHSKPAADPEALKKDFWKALADSPFLFLQRTGESDTAVPMSPQLDKDANSAIWFFTSRDNRFAKMGGATATFSSKGHDVFARFHGMLVEETDRAVLEEHLIAISERDCRRQAGMQGGRHAVWLAR